MRWLAAFIAASFIVAGAHAAETITYQYDVHGRLTQVNHSGTVNDGLQSIYAYDQADNRTSVAVTGGWTCGGSSAAVRSSMKAGSSAKSEATEAAETVSIVKTIIITSGSSLTTPSDWCWPWSITAIGGGASGRAGTSGGGGAGGGAGAFAQINQSDAVISPGQTIYFSVGSGGAASSSGGGNDGGDTWVNFTANIPPEGPEEGLLAKSGSASLATTNGGIGGQASASIGSTTLNGGDGGAPSLIAGSAGSGGGGAAGPRGPGGNGGGAGGAGGGSGGSGGTGGLGTSTGIGGAGAAGTDYVETSVIAGGGGGGGGGAGMTSSAGPAGGAAGLYGGGGGGGGGGATTGGTSGAGALGVLILTYTGVDYDPDAKAYFAALTTQPDTTRKGLINNLVVGLKADNLWAKIDWLLLLASQDYATTKQANRVNLRNPAKIATANGTLTYSAIGVQGNGSNGEISINENWGAAGNVYAQNSAFLISYVNGGTGSQDEDVGNPGGTRQLLSSSQSSVSEQMALNNTTSSSYTVTSSGKTGSRILTRTASTTTILYKNGVAVNTNSTASTSTGTNDGSIFGGNGLFSASRMSIAGSGGGLSATEAANLHTRILTFLTAIGAN